MESLHDYALAQKLLAEKNCEELFLLYEKAIRDRNQALQMVARIADIYMGTNKLPMYQPPSNSIAAMQSVSLAAIQLAREVAVNGKAKR